MQIRISDIKIKERIRRDLGSLQPLMESLREHGLMNPVVINKKNELIAGHRRLESARLLGWQFITATVLDKATELEKLEMEIAENVQRLDLTDEELAAAQARLERLKNPGFFRRLFNGVLHFFKKLFWEE